MSDPAVDAARRARMDGRSTHVQRVAAAREALKQSFGFRGNEPLDTRPPELWIDLVHDECGGDW